MPNSFLRPFTASHLLYSVLDPPPWKTEKVRRSNTNIYFLLDILYIDVKFFGIIAKLMNKTELVLPGGDYNRARIALDFGADAVYVGLNKYSLRKGEVRYNLEELERTIQYAHSLKKKIYVTFNIFAHNKHLKTLKADMEKVANLSPDAFIIADIGVINIARKIAPQIPIHVSTQANTTNLETVKFYQELGIKRVVLARELTLKEITEIHKAVPKIELEVFVHGSMCISYSGRCLLSNYMTGRQANLGDCAQPCRWNYNVYLEEKQRPNEFFKIEESNEGTNIMSSKDICLIEHIDKLERAGVTGLKVEGRNKTEYYLAATALAYKKALELSKKNSYTTNEKKKLKRELQKIAHRDYTTGFIYEKANKGGTYQGRSPICNWEYIGIIIKDSQVIVKNKISKGALVELLTPDGIKKDEILKIVVNDKETNVISPGRNGQTAKILLKNKYPVGTILRTETSS